MRRLGLRTVFSGAAALGQLLRATDGADQHLREHLTIAGKTRAPAAKSD